MIRLFPILMFTLIALLLFGALLDGPPKTGGTISGPRIDKPMPTLALMNADNATADLGAADFRGKVTLINLLASWCAPCEAEMGELVALKKSHDAVRFIGIAWNDAPRNIGPWLKEHGDPFDAMRYDPQGRAAIALGVRGIPETYVVDAKGTVRYQLSGPLTETLRINELEPLLEQLQAEAKDAR